MRYASFLACCALPLFAFATLEPVSDWKASFGGDFRFRHEMYREMNTNLYGLAPTVNPNATNGIVPSNSYLRIRTRLWGELEHKYATFYVRAANEFRHYFLTDSYEGDRRFPDQLFIDNLYVDLRLPDDSLTLRIGRQDYRPGSGRLLGEGTPADGSRSSFYDGARLRWNFEKERSLDLFALYGCRHDWLPKLGRRDPPNQRGGKSFEYEYSALDQWEWFTGAYYTDRSNKALGWDAYLVLKGEEDRRVLQQYGYDYSEHTITVGTRLLPKFSETLSGELEIALQTGENMSLAAMVYGALTRTFVMDWKPSLTLACLWYSGDSDGQRGEHAWRDVGNRALGFGDLDDPFFLGGSISNLIYPHVDFSITPAEGHLFALRFGPMFQQTSWKDQPGGNTYGLFGYFLYDITLEKVVGDWMKGANLSFYLEYLHEGSFVESDVRGNALYACTQLLWTF
ncbi:MAG: alginate export family protein [Kiritimatiellae bacterium]|nr:alginate export family protein [Kiritimatiellia bacterium]